MDQYGNCAGGLLVNGKPLEVFGGCALLDYSVGETELHNETFQGINRTTWQLLKATFGRRPISITIVFTGADLHAAKMQRSVLNGELFGKSEIFIPGDGFFYDVVCESLGAEERVGEGDAEGKIKATYTFKGIRRGRLSTETVPAGGSLFCRSSMPFTDCRLTVTVGASAAAYPLGGATFQNVTAGDVLVFDGMNGRITKNGQPYAASVNWVHFPTLTPGMNVNGSPDPVTVAYYPTFI